jgi:hypothetical protein
MKRTIAVISLTGFLSFTGIFVFVYLFRAFRYPEPTASAPVVIWHGDPMMRAVLAAVLFTMGLVLLLLLAVARSDARSSGSVKVRADLWEWVSARAADTNEPAERIVDRAIAWHRDQLGEHAASDG